MAWIDKAVLIDVKDGRDIYKIDHPSCKISIYHAKSSYDYDEIYITVSGSQASITKSMKIPPVLDSDLMEILRDILEDICDDSETLLILHS